MCVYTLELGFLHINGNKRLLHKPTDKIGTLVTIWS